MAYLNNAPSLYSILKKYKNEGYNSRKETLILMKKGKQAAPEIN
jgi:hypothetical protein